MARLRLSDERGFSMVELMVVILIIGVLVGISVPTFLGMRRRFEDTAAKESAILAIKAAVPIGADGGEMFDGVTTAALNSAEPSLTFVDGSQQSTANKGVSQTTALDDTLFIAAVRSASGTCFVVRHQAAGSDFVSFHGGTCRADEHTSLVFGSTW